MSSRVERKVFHNISERARSALAVLQSYEQDEIEITPALGLALEEMPLRLLVFACLGTVRGREDLRLNLSETIFMKKFRGQTERLLRAFENTGVRPTLTILLPDLEPKRTWGWQTSQEELTGLCSLMIEDAAPLLPTGWSVSLWSDIEAKASASYEQTLRLAQTSASPLILRDETLFFRKLGEQHPDILTRRDPKTLARCQIAAYAHEGRVLEETHPQGILLQSDTPVRRKDAMFNLLRSAPIPIAHPFTR